MKKITTILVIAAAALSCSTAEQETAIPSNVSVTVSASQVSASQSRVAVSEDSQTGKLLVSWAESDNLGAWEAAATSFSKFSMDSGSMSADGNKATFSGNVEGAEYRLMHPYTNQIAISGDKCEIDLAQQSAGVSSMNTMSKSTYMLSTPITVGDSTEPAMQHVASAVKLALRFTNLPKGEVTLQSVELGGGDGISIPTAASIDFTKDVEDAGFLTATNNGSIAVAVEGTPVVENYESDEEYTIFFNALPFELAAGATLEVKVTLASAGQSYTQAYSITKDRNVELARASYLSIKKICDMSGFVVEQDPVPFKFLFDTAGDAEGWYLGSNSYLDNMVVADGYMNLNYKWGASNSKGYNRADLYYKNPVLDTENFPILAIKWINGSALSTIRLHSALGNFRNASTNNHSGTIGDDVFYYDLTKGFGGKSVDVNTKIATLDWISTMKDASFTDSKVAWIISFASIEELEAYVDAEQPTVTPSSEPFEFLFDTDGDTEGWKINTPSKYKKDETISVADGSLLLNYDWTTSASYSRLDIAYDDPKIDAVKYPILAVKWESASLLTTFKLHSSDGYFNNASAAIYKTGVKGVDKDVFYYDLSLGFGKDKVVPSSETKSIDWNATMKTKTCASSKIAWIKNFESVAALDAYLATSGE